MYYCYISIKCTTEQNNISYVIFDFLRSGCIFFNSISGYENAGIQFAAVVLIPSKRRYYAAEVLAPSTSNNYIDTDVIPMSFRIIITSDLTLLCVNWLIILGLNYNFFS